MSNDAVVFVAFDGEDFVVTRSHDANMIGLLILVPVKENQIALFGFVAVGFLIHVLLFQVNDPGLAAGAQRHIFHFGIMDAEGGEHGAPVAIGGAVPLAIACVAPAGFSIIQHDIVLGAFAISKLCLGDGNHVFGPVAAEGYVMKCTLPVPFAFYIGRKIGITDQSMNVFFLFARQHLDVCAGICMGVIFVRRQTAGCIGFKRKVAFICVYVQTFFGKIAQQAVVHFDFIFVAEQHGGISVAFGCMHMAFAFGKRADDDMFMTGIVVYVIFRLRANN